MRPVAQDQFLSDEAGLDRLAEADIVGDQQVDARHLDGAYDRIELVILNSDATTERGLQGAHVGGRDRAPAHGIEEGVQDDGIIEAIGPGQLGPFAYPGSRLQFPDNVQFFAQRVVLDG